MAAMRCQMQSSVSGASSARCLRTRTQAFSGPRTAAGLRLPSTGLRPASITAPRRIVEDCSSSQGRLVKCNGLFGLGLPEIAVIAGIAALVFGPSKLPELGKGLGKTMKSFQTAAKEFETELKAASADDDKEKVTPEGEAVVKKVEEKKE